ncbi:MAG TPA: carboxypeptidase regulatory-like domain-containing protein [Kofleriaceae bacterium]|jgi:protocatechuate 3,4-dioxygenase beta subunit
MSRRVVGAVVAGVVLAAIVVLYLVHGAPPGALGEGAGSSTATGSGGGVMAPAAQRAAIRGRVTNAKGALPGATVCAANRWDVTACVASDAQGAYSIENLAAGAYRVSATAAQHRPANTEWLYLGAGDTRDKIDLVLRAGVLLSGKVQDINGGPIAGAHVRVKSSDSWETLGVRGIYWSAPATSGEDGAFALWTSPGNVELDASASGYASGSADANAPTQVVILLMPEGSMSGTVVDKSGKPIADAQVIADTLGAWRETRTDGDGAFSIARLPAGRYKVWASAPDGYGEHAGTVAVELGRQTSDVKIQLLAAFRISGVVMLGDAPCPAPRVELREPVTEVERAMLPDGSGGAVHIDGLLPGPYVLHPICDGGLPFEAPFPRLVVVDKDQSKLVWRVTPGATLTGRVTTADGKPVADATIETKGPWADNATTNDDGRYTIRGLRPGAYTVTATALDGGAAEGSIALKGAETATLDLEVDTAARITGTVVDSLGREVKGLEVRADPTDKKRQEGTSLSGENTGSMFDIAVKPGSYHVYAAVDWSHPIEPGTDVTVAAGQRVSVQLEVPAQDGVIKGSVVDRAGGPVGDAVVTAKTASGFWAMDFAIGWNEHPTLTAADGTFAITKLGPGEYKVTATRPGAPPASQDGVAPSGAPIKLTIETPASIAGTAAYADGKHARELVVRIRDESKTVYREERFVGTNGAFRIEDVPTGPIKLTIEDPDRGFVATSLTLAPGDAKKDLALTLGATVAITGHLVDDKKHPIADVPVLVESADSLAHPGSFDDDFVHASDATGAFSVQAPLGPILINARKMDYRELHQLCQAELKTTIDGPTDVGVIEMKCRTL